MKFPHSSFSFFLLGCAVAASCSRVAPVEMPEFEHSEANSIYYWRTEFRLDSTERQFLENHDIEKMYIRFFDVVAEDYYAMGDSKEIIPNATIRFIDSVPEPVKNVVPTVFITVDALREMNGKENDVASKIVHRVLNMVSYNEIPAVSELQLDCDWTRTTDSIYFRLCRAVTDTLRASSDKDFTLSSTIRLHQLKQAAPPVDYGVLMCYNTGSFKNPKASNSILDYNDVQPYFKKDIYYPLHLDVAYPVYDWTLRFRDDKFAGIVRTDSVAPVEGETFRHEKSDISTVLNVKKLVDNHLLGSQPAHSVILYHLDSHNISHYSDNEISKIYSGSHD